MKRVLLLASLMIFGFTATSHAQLQEGNIMLGADLGSGVTTTATNGLFGFNLGLEEDSGYNIGLSPKMGYFINDDFVLGGILNLGYYNPAGDDDETSNMFIYGIQAFSRYYLTPEDIELGDEVPAGQFFIETNAGLAGSNIEDGDTTNGFAFGFGPGYSLFLNENVALDASLKYSGLAGGGNDNYTHSLGINLGVQIFLSKNEAEDTVEQF
ncbi:hypothetical protein JRG66_04615 [Salinimicrobium tongyeongense]|uniref:Outer membrane protein beta-barrel domain-containing protein n=1 Tax=Salinimicrobium tongyeongense TaxID=2809707 RepID=A0ABY6NTQ2_9FLAO|nr:porin family protein [Salinimicrobium tongyeongense]UZH56154.1 hypothetical protein JRG66_04615 [Salinimicrobium tongyeongense]